VEGNAVPEKYNELVKKYQKRLSQNKKVNAIFHFGSSFFNDSWEQSDIDLLIVVEDNGDKREIFIKDQDGVCVHLQILNYDSFRKMVLSDQGGEFHSIILDGQIIYDRDGNISLLVDEARKKSHEYFRLRTMLEFSHLLNKYYQSKKLYSQEKHLDSYRQLLESMVHWAKIVIYESNQFPRKDLWNQVKTLNFGVYKLYEELSFSQEPLLQRIELMQLVYLNMVLSKASEFCKPVLEYIKEKGRGVTYQEIVSDPLFSSLDYRMEALLGELVRIGILSTGVLPMKEWDTGDNSLFRMDEIIYWADV